MEQFRTPGSRSRSGFSQWCINSFERGRCNPTTISPYELANAIGAPVADLIADEATAASESAPPDMLKATLAGPKIESG